MRLGVSLKASLIRSREYITLLYKFGKSVNYHKVLVIDAYWAEEIIEDDGHATISTHIVFGECAQATFDNADYGQKMLHNMLPIMLFTSLAAMESFKVILFSGLLHTLRSFWEMATCKQILVTPKRLGVS